MNFLENHSKSFHGSFRDFFWNRTTAIGLISFSFNVDYHKKICAMKDVLSCFSRSQNILVFYLGLLILDHLSSNLESKLLLESPLITVTITVVVQTLWPCYSKNMAKLNRTTFTHFPFIWKSSFLYLFYPLWRGTGVLHLA